MAEAFETGIESFPKFLGTSYDAVVFALVRAASLIKGSEFSDFSSLRELKPFEGLEALEVVPESAQAQARASHTILRELGCTFTYAADSEVGLANPGSLSGQRFDLTFSNGLLSQSEVQRSMELYAVFANITKKDGYSIHACGSHVSTLYSTFLDFLGFRICSYFRFGSGRDDFVLVLRKYNGRETTLEEFRDLYQLLQARDPARYR